MSDRPKPYEHENEFIIDMLYDSFLNTDTPYCDKAVAEVLGVGSRRIMHARKVVRRLINDPSLLLEERMAPAHGMNKYSSQHHPVNRTSIELRRAIAQGLDLALRADPVASDGMVTFRFYDPNVNTYEKIKEMLHNSMSESLGEGSIGELSSTTFKRIFAEYLAERDGTFSFATADHNCCPHGQDLELSLSAMQMELKVLERQSSPDIEAIAQRSSQVEESKRAYEEHVGWDRKWRSQKARALLTHQDDMTKPNVPSFVEDSLSDLARYRLDVTAHVSAITGNALVMSHELGGVQKNSGSIFESILIDHLLTCRGENLKIVWSDCAPVGRSFFLCVASMQYLVDSGFCDLALSGYMANCHVEWQENLARLGYAVNTPVEFGWENMNPHYACACRQRVKESLPAELLSLLEPLIPKHENCVRITSWPRFDEPHSRIPFEQRPIDVPARQIRPRTAKEISKGRPLDSEWYLFVPRSRPFAESGPGVVPRTTASKVGHNASGYLSRVPLLRHSGALRNLSWPSDFHGPPHASEADMKVAPENWIARKTVQSCSTNPTARYPPLNYYNALQGRPPRMRTNKHKFVATYAEPPFPIVEGTCAQTAARWLDSEFKGRLEASVSVLDLYRAVKCKMDLGGEEELDEHLQPRAKAPSEEAEQAYPAILKEKKLRLKHRPLAKRSAFQIFRSDDEVAASMADLLSRKKQAGDTRATLASVSKKFWETATAQFKKKYEDLVGLEDDRVSREYVQYRKWLKGRDDLLDSASCNQPPA